MKKKAPKPASAAKMSACPLATPTATEPKKR
jgi:hypothetical protein